MENDSEHLVFSFRETKRYFSYGGDNLLILPRFNSFLSQYDNCLFAVPLPKSDESTSLTESLLKDELLEDIDLDQSDSREVLCILDSNEENLYNERRYPNRCVISLGGISRFLVNPSSDQLIVLFSNNIMCVYSLLSDKNDWLYLFTLATIKVNNNNRGINAMCVNDNNIFLGLMDGTVLVYHKGKFNYSFRLSSSPITLLKNFKEDKLFLSNRVGDLYLYDLAHKVELARFKDHTTYVKSLHFIVTTANDVGLITLDNDNVVNLWALNSSFGSVGLNGLENQNEDDLLVLVDRERLVTPFKRIIKHENVVSVFVVTSKVNEDVDRRKKGSWVLLVVEESGQLYYEDPTDESILMRNEVMYGFGLVKGVEYSKDLIMLLSLNGSIMVYDHSFRLIKLMLSNFNNLFQFSLLNNDNKEEENKEDEEEDDKEEDLEMKDIEMDEEDSEEEDKENRENKQKEKEIEEKEKVEDKRNCYEYSKRWYERNMKRGKRSRMMVVLVGDEVVRVLLLNNLNEFVPLGLSNVNLTHQDVVTSIYYDENSKLLLSGSKDKLVVLWDMKRLIQLRLINTIHIVTSLLLLTTRLSHNNVVDIVCSSNNLINLYSTKLNESSVDEYRRLKETSRELDKSDHTSVIHKSNVNHLALSHNQKYISSCSNDKTIVVHQANNLIVKGRCVGHRKSVLFVRFMKVTKTLVSSSMDQTIKIWSLTNFTNIKTFQGHTNSIMKVVVLHNDLQLLSCGLDGFVKLWNIPSSECVQTLNDHESQQIWDIEFSGNLLYSASNNLIVVSEDVSKELKRAQVLQEREEEVVSSKINALLLRDEYRESLVLAIKMNNIKLTNEILQKYTNKKVFGGESLVTMYSNRLVVDNNNEEDKENKDNEEKENKEQNNKEENKENKKEREEQEKEREEQEKERGEDIFNYVIENIKNSNEEEKKKILKNLLGFVKIWISNRKTYYIGNVFLNKMLKQLKVEELLKIEGLLDTIEFLLFNLSNHQSRLSNMQEKSYIMDIITQHNPLSQPNSSNVNDVLYK